MVLNCSSITYTGKHVLHEILAARLVSSTKPNIRSKQWKHRFIDATSCLHNA